MSTESQDRRTSELEAEVYRLQCIIDIHLEDLETWAALGGEGDVKRFKNFKGLVEYVPPPP